MVQKNKRGVLNHKVNVIGASVLGAPIEVYGPSKSTVPYMVIAGQHGTEPETTLLLSYVLRGMDPNDLCCPVILSTNPDGIQRGTRGNANGVDLNRNFPTTNWKKDLVYHRWEKGDTQGVELSPGSSPESEPETKALLSYISKLNVKTVVTIHAPLNCIDDEFKTPLSVALAKDMNLPLVDDIGYPTPGSFGSWGRENNVSVITVELPYKSIHEHRQDYTMAIEKLLKGQYL